MRDRVRTPALKPYLTAADCIDWSLPMLSIFAIPAEASAFAKRHGCGTPRRPLKPKTLARIAGGLDKFVIRAAKPFIVTMANGSFDTAPSRILDPDLPINTVTGCPKHAAADVTLAPYSVPRYGERPGQPPRCQSIEEPAATITGTGNGSTLVAATLTRDYGRSAGAAVDQPAPTMTGMNHTALVAALVTKHYTGVTGSPADAPLDTVTATDHNAVTCAYLTKHYGNPGYAERPGIAADVPLSTVTASDHHSVAAVHMMKFRGDSVGTAADEPVPTVTSGAGAARDAGAAHALGVGVAYLSQMYGTNRGTNGDAGKPAAAVTGTGNHASVVTASAVPYLIGAGGAAYAAKPKSVDEPANTVMVNDRRAIVAAFISTYYGNSKDGHPVSDPMPTVVSKDRIQLVTVIIDGTTYVVTDIAMRMLTPRELANAQGFPADYVIDRTADGKPVSKADQVKLIGNAVPPAFARAIVKANVVDQGVLGDPPRRKRRPARKAVSS